MKSQDLKSFFALAKGNRGSALINALIFTALIAAVVMAAQFMMGQISQRIALFQFYESLSQFDNKMNVFVIDPLSCQLSLQGQTAHAGSSLVISSGLTGNSGMKIGDSLGKAKITAITIESKTPVPLSPNKFDLKIRFDYSTQGLSTESSGTKSVKVRAVLDSTSKVTECYGDRSPQYLCEQAGGMYNLNGSPVCTIPLAFAGNCTGNQKLTGFSSEGRIVCR